MARSKPAEKKRNARVVSGPTAPGVAQSAGEAVIHALRPLLPLVALGALYAGAACLLWMPVHADARARLTREALLQPMLQAKGRPACLSESETRKLVQRGQALEGRSVFEPGLAQELARAYEASPWIERVGAVQVRFPAAVRIESLRWRLPFARVEIEGGYAVLDRQGVVLPTPAEDLFVPRGPNYLAGQVELPSLAGAPCRKREAGERIEEAPIAEGLELLGILKEALPRAPGGWKPARVQRDAFGLWRIFLVHGPVVEWGCMEDEHRPVHEPGLHEKKEALVRRLSERGAARLRSINLTEPRAPVTPAN